MYKALCLYHWNNKLEELIRCTNRSENLTPQQELSQLPKKHLKKWDFAQEIWWGMTEATILPVKMNSSDWLLITRAVGENNTVEEDS